MESNHRQVAYETTALPLSYRDIILVRTERIELSTTGWKPVTLPLRHARVNSGAGTRIRTPDLMITNQLLYQLSYTGKNGREDRD